MAASSVQDSSFPASAAVDGSLSTRWSSAFSDPQWIYVDLGAEYNISEVDLNWEAAYAKAYQIQVSNDATNWTTIYSTTSGTGGVNDLTGLSGTGRYVRMYGTARATSWGYSLWEFAVYGTPVDLALDRPVAASSVQDSSFPASAAVDGSLSTRWSSAFSDPQSIYVDLGATYNISQVVLNWEAAYATAYQIQVSNNASTWTTIYSTTSGTGGVNDLTGLSGTGRYVRMYGTARATSWGYSLWEMSVYGSPATTATPTTTSTTTTPTTTSTTTTTPTSTTTSPTTTSTTTTTPTTTSTTTTTPTTTTTSSTTTTTTSSSA
ncbi:MAG: discoidin domain-containing protein, partial [Solirubrobacteraceae bacterium]